MPLCSNLRWLLEELPRNNNDKLPAEDYTNVKDECIPNASMSLEDIYNRIAKGIPMDLTGMETQRLDPHGEFSAEQRNEDLDTFVPLTSAPGSLERMDEIQQRAQQTIDGIRSQSVATNIEGEDKQEPDTIDSKPDYSAMRQAAKDDKKGKKQTE